MDGSSQVEDPLAQLEWDDFLDQLPELPVDDDFLQAADATVVSAADYDLSPSPNTVFSEIENLLMADDGNDVVPGTPSSESDYDKLLAEILLDDQPRGESDEGSSPSDKDSDKDRASAATPEEVEAADEPLSKKQRRQMRNRDAAVKSRERKKLYVKNLEMKSRYYEGECRRLAHLLQCCYAENHALRLCLQSRDAAFGAPMTTQESAVLLLESLLLGSLLWFVGIMCQLSLPLMLCLIEVLPRENMAQKKGLRKMVPKGRERKDSEYFWVQSFVKSRKCRASRTKMKLDYLAFYNF